MQKNKETGKQTAKGGKATDRRDKFIHKLCFDSSTGKSRLISQIAQFKDRGARTASLSIPTPIPFSLLLRGERCQCPHTHQVAESGGKIIIHLLQNRRLVRGTERQMLSQRAKKSGVAGA